MAFTVSKPSVAEHNYFLPLAYLSFAVVIQGHTYIFKTNSHLGCVFLPGTSIWPARAAEIYVRNCCRSVWANGWMRKIVVGVFWTTVGDAKLL